MKKLMAIAIAAGVAAPAMADATLYGVLHGSLDLLDGAAGGLETTVSSNKSRIGVKGSTALSGGLKGIYKAEWGIDTGGANSVNGTNNSNTFNNRNQIIGVSGGFGTVFLGRHDTALKVVGRKADLFWSSQLGQNRNIVRQDVNWDARYNNTLAYQSPNLGGFKGLATYVTDINGSEDNTVISLNGFYHAGPITVGAAWESREFANTIDATTGASASVADAEAFRLMGSYKFGAAKVVGFYQDEDNSGAEADVWGLGGAYKVSSQGTVKIQYYERSRDNIRAADGTLPSLPDGTLLSLPDGTLLALGYDHKLGKKTDVYAQYAMTEDLGGIGGRAHGSSIAADASGEASGVSFGLRHKF